MSEPIRIAMVGGGVMGGALVEGFLGAVVEGRPTVVSVVEADPVRWPLWRDLLLETCNEPTIIGISNHLLIIAEKP